jgi:hypothetical protein
MGAPLFVCGIGRSTGQFWNLGAIEGQSQCDHFAAAKLSLLAAEGSTLGSRANMFGLASHQRQVAGQTLPLVFRESIIWGVDGLGRNVAEHSTPISCLLVEWTLMPICRLFMESSSTPSWSERPRLRP